MSRMFRFASALLILASLTCGSLGAFPLYPGITPTPAPTGGILAAFVEWISSLPRPDRPADTAPHRSQPKDGAAIDPVGGGGGGGG